MKFWSNLNIFIQANAFEYVVWKMAAFCCGLNVLKEISDVLYSLTNRKYRWTYVAWFVTAYSFIAGASRNNTAIVPSVSMAHLTSPASRLAIVLRAVAPSPRLGRVVGIPPSDLHTDVVAAGGEVSVEGMEYWLVYPWTQRPECNNQQLPQTLPRLAWRHVAVTDGIMWWEKQHHCQ